MACLRDGGEKSATQQGVFLLLRKPCLPPCRQPAVGVDRASTVKTEGPILTIYPCSRLAFVKYEGCQMAP